MCQWCERSAFADHLTAGLSRGRRQFLTHAGMLAAGAVLPVMAEGRQGRARSHSKAREATSTAAVIFHNGTIHSMAAGRRPAEALAVHNGRILAIGSREDVMAHAGPSTHMIDLQRRTVLPGLIDPHNHTVLSSLFDLLLINIGFFQHKTKADAAAVMRAAAARTPAGQWLAFGFYDNLLQGGDWSMGELDAISADHPILVMYVNGHVGAANALAFQRTKIGSDVGTIAGGGSFGRSSDGRLNGLIYNEPALLPFLTLAVPQPTPELLEKAVKRYSEQARAAGLTAMHEPGTVKPEWVPQLARLSQELPVRLSASFSTDMVEASLPFARLGPSTRARRIPDSRFSLYGMKFWADGSNQAETAAQTQPYLNSRRKGQESYTPAEMVALCQKAKDAGWTILCHCQGDASVDEYLNAMERVYGAMPATGLNRVEHATMARQDQIERMKRLGCEPSFITDFVYLYAAAYRDQLFGPERADFMVPVGAAARLGIGYSLHSDNPAAGLPLNPLRLVQTAVTRRCMVDGSVVGADLALSIDQALRGITQHAARQMGLGDEIGTLEPGKEADLTILESDPYRTDPERLMAIRVSETWVAGDPQRPLPA